MNRKGGDWEDSGGKQWEAKRAVKSLYPSARRKPENLVKFTSYARIKRKHWISGDAGTLVTVQQKIVVYCPPLHSIVQQRYASNLLYCALCIIHISAIHVDSGALGYIYHNRNIIGRCFNIFPTIKGRRIAGLSFKKMAMQKSTAM